MVRNLLISCVFGLIFLTSCGGTKPCTRGAQANLPVQPGPFLVVRATHDAIWFPAMETWAQGYATLENRTSEISLAGWEYGDCELCVHLLVGVVKPDGTRVPVTIPGRYQFRRSVEGLLVEFVPGMAELGDSVPQLQRAVDTWVKTQNTRPVFELRVPLIKGDFEVTHQIDAESLTLSVNSPSLPGAALAGNHDLEVAYSPGFERAFIRQNLEVKRAEVQAFEWTREGVRVQWQEFADSCDPVNKEWNAKYRPDGALEAIGPDLGLLRVVLSLHPKAIVGVPLGSYVRKEQSWIGESRVDPQSAVLASMNGEILRCYAKARESKPNLAGSVEIEWRVDEYGSASDVRALHDDTASPVLTDCLSKTIAEGSYVPMNPAQRIRRRFEFQDAPGAPDN